MTWLTKATFCCICSRWIRRCTGRILRAARRIAIRPTFAETPGPYRGPVPIVTHVHGNHAHDHSDGYAEAWYLPAADNIPAGYATEGTFYDVFREESPLGELWEPGNAVFEYPNDQRASTMWYHDHTLGMTRLNVYAGPAGFYLLRRGLVTFPHPYFLGRRRGLAIPRERNTTRFRSRSRIARSTLTAHCSTQTLGRSSMTSKDRTSQAATSRPSGTQSSSPTPWSSMAKPGLCWRWSHGGTGFVAERLQFPVPHPQTGLRRDRQAGTRRCPWMIGAEGGFLPEPERLDQVLLAPAERADVIVDFTGVPVGTAIHMVNLGPDEPFGGPDFEAADPDTTGQVMKFKVVPLASRDRSRPPDKLTLPAFKPLGPASNTRRVSLNERASSFPGFDGPVAALLGTVDGTTPKPLVGTMQSPRTRRSTPSRSGSSTTSPRTPTPSTFMKCNSRS